MSLEKQNKSKTPDVASKHSSSHSEPQNAETFSEAAPSSTAFQEATPNLQALRHRDLLQLQRAVGNQAVSRLLKGQPGSQSQDGTRPHQGKIAQQALLRKPEVGPPGLEAMPGEATSGTVTQEAPHTGGPVDNQLVQQKPSNSSRGSGSVIQRGVKDLVAAIEAREKQAKEERIFGRGGKPVSKPPEVTQAEIKVIETFMQQRKVSAHYKDEKTVQRPDLIQAITITVGKLKQQYQAYKAAESTADPTTNDKKALWQKTLVFLRKQDVVVTDEGDFDPNSLTGRLVEYDEAAPKQESTRVSVAGGSFKRSTGDPVDTKDSVTFQRGIGWEIFVMGPGGDIHMASHKIGKYHHSSLLGGGSVAAAGMMRVTGGTLQELNNHSGHYQPKEEHLRQVVRHLQVNGVPLNFTLEILGGVYKGPAADYMKGTTAGGKGGEETFESDSTVHIIKHFFAAKGQVAVKQAIESAGWTWVTLMGGQWLPQKGDGSRPTHKEVRDLLTTHFGEQAAPNVTQD